MPSWRSLLAFLWSEKSPRQAGGFFPSPKKSKLTNKISQIRERLGLVGVPRDESGAAEAKLELGDDVEAQQDEEDALVAPEGFFERGAHSLAAASCFSDLGLSRPLLRAVAGLGWTRPSPVQSAVVPLALEGRDLCVSANTVSFVLVEETLLLLLWVSDGVASKGVGQDRSLCAAGGGAPATAAAGRRGRHARAGAGAHARAGRTVREVSHREERKKRVLPVCSSLACLRS